MNERLKKLRKFLDLTQQEFADKIKVKRNTVATYEMGRSEPSDAAVSLICKEFNVNEKWLRTGEGEMLKPDTNNELEALAEKYGLSHTSYIFMEKFLQMKEQHRQILFDFCKEVVTATLADEIASDTPSIPSNNESEEIEERIAAYRDFLETREKATGKLSS